jgi:DNA-binding IclR family transcriptional regulator
VPLPTGALERRTPRTITNRADLQRDLALVASRGYAVAREELEPGLVAIASPVRAHDGATVAAISVSGPTARISQRVADEVGALLVAEAASLSALLGHASIADRTRRRPA